MRTFIFFNLIIFVTLSYGQVKNDRSNNKFDLDKIVKSDFNFQNIKDVNCFTGIYFTRLSFDRSKRVIVITDDSLPSKFKLELERIINIEENKRSFLKLHRTKLQVVQPIMIHLEQICNNTFESIGSDTSFASNSVYRMLTYYYSKQLLKLINDFKDAAKRYKDKKGIFMLKPCVIEYDVKKWEKRRDNVN